MDKEDIIKLAREADMDVDHAESAWGAIITAEPADLERFAALVAAKEREALAKICEEYADWLEESEDFQRAAWAVRQAVKRMRACA